MKTPKPKDEAEKGNLAYDAPQGYSVKSIELEMAGEAPCQFCGIDSNFGDHQH